VADEQNVFLPQVVGWQQLDDGGYEYIIQIEPEMLDSLRAGRNILSDLPPALQNIRRYRITVGNEPLPHEGIPPELIAGPPPAGTDAGEFEVGQPAVTDDAAGPPLLIDPQQQIPIADWPGPGDADPVLAPALESGLAGEAPPPDAQRYENPPRPAVGESTVDVVESAPVPEAPGTLEVPADSRSLVEPTSGLSEAPTPTVAEDGGVGEETAQPSLSAKPPLADEAEPRDWWLLTATLVGLFLSLGANLFLVWVTWGTRSRYRELLDRADLHPSPA